MITFCSKCWMRYRLLIGWFRCNCTTSCFMFRCVEVTKNRANHENYEASMTQKYSRSRKVSLKCNLPWACSPDDWQHGRTPLGGKCCLPLSVGFFANPSRESVAQSLQVQMQWPLNKWLSIYYITLHEDSLPVGGRCSHLYKDLVKKSYLTFQVRTDRYALESVEMEEHRKPSNSIQQHWTWIQSQHFVKFRKGTLGESNSSLFVWIASRFTMESWCNDQVPLRLRQQM